MESKIEIDTYFIEYSEIVMPYSKFAKMQKKVLQAN
jgi:hypothetical protein